MIDYNDILSPCKNICRMDATNTFCIGCFRTFEEKKSWWKFSKEEKLNIIELCKKGKLRFKK
jgi:predicted Fe-S protein YdhL (DUF1289 family)